MLDSTPQSGHTRVMSLGGMATMIGPIAGPMLGGFLTENLNWRWVFYINVPIGIPTIANLWWLLPAPASTPRKLDMFGFIVLALGLAAIQLALDRGLHEDWLESWEIILELAIGVAAIWIFVIHSLTAHNPLFETVLFKNRTFVITLFFMVVMGFLMFGVSSLLPSLLQSVFGFPVIDSGILSAPRGAGIMLCMYLMPQLIARFPRKWIIATGYAIAALSIQMMIGWSLETDATAIVFSGVVQGLGMGLTFIPLNTLAFENLPPHLRTDGASLLNLMRTFGGSIGISFFATSIARSIQYNHEELGGRITETTIPNFNPDLLREFGAYGDAIFKMVDLEVLRQSTMLAYLNSFQMLFYLILIAPLLAAFLQSDRKLKAPKSPLEGPH